MLDHLSWTRMSLTGDHYCLRLSKLGRSTINESDLKPECLKKKFKLHAATATSTASRLNYQIQTTTCGTENLCWNFCQYPLTDADFFDVEIPLFSSQAQVSFAKKNFLLGPLDLIKDRKKTSPSIHWRKRRSPCSWKPCCSDRRVRTKNCDSTHCSPSSRI